MHLKFLSLSDWTLPTLLSMGVVCWEGPYGWRPLLYLNKLNFVCLPVKCSLFLNGLNVLYLLKGSMQRDMKDKVYKFAEDIHLEPEQWRWNETCYVRQTSLVSLAAFTNGHQNDEDESPTMYTNFHLPCAVWTDHGIRDMFLWLCSLVESEEYCGSIFFVCYLSTRL